MRSVALARLGLPRVVFDIPEDEMDTFITNWGSSRLTTSADGFHLG